MRPRHASRPRGALSWPVALGVSVAAVILAVIIIGFVVSAWARRAQARRSAVVRQKYAERCGACPDVHFEAPLGKRFCGDAAACLPALDHAHSTAAFGREPIWAAALEWMADRVGGVARRRLYWTEACVMRADHLDSLGDDNDGRCALVIDLELGRVIATTRRPVVAFGSPADRQLVVAILDGQPRAVARGGGHASRRHNHPDL
ncbi:hypothetical protein pkur_cds_232 [Pandoravirus kuranda]|uniref:T cell CD4 receptor C-terminal region domain-containing protein n=2 Tax=Pandoravirus TaxID=2060084 RepID=A0AA95ECU6_9VIRU|nr:hypothetical protein pneo_cds_258 [Pandoravirus neocaledonia]AVK75865.1 hypothetical protein pneo_cds_258 [Pandoravirus neocaledonia]WBR14407.1 hypothetical protein pkur_cds_232 [Pandoravirus kuranda]